VRDTKAGKQIHNSSRYLTAVKLKLTGLGRLWENAFYFWHNEFL